MSKKAERLPLADVLAVLAAISALVKVVFGLWLAWRRRNFPAAVEALQAATKDADIRAALAQSGDGRKILAAIDETTPGIAAAGLRAAGLVKQVRLHLWEAKVILEERVEHEARERYYEAHGHYPGEG